MGDFRCICKKLLFQIEGDSIIIKCRHCKRFVRIRTRGLLNVEYSTADEKVEKLHSAI